MQFGKPPNRIALINTIDGVTFQEAWDSRVKEKIFIQDKEFLIYLIGPDMLIKNKSAAKRHKVMEDLKFLQTQIPRISG